MKNNLFYIVCVILTCSLAGCTDVPDEFGFEGSMTMTLVNSEPVDATYYDATYDVTLNVKSKGSDFMITGAGIRDAESVNLSKLVEQQGGTMRVTLKNLQFDREYNFVPYFKTESFTFEGEKVASKAQHASFLTANLQEALLPEYNKAVLTLSFNLFYLLGGDVRDYGIEVANNGSFTKDTYKRYYTYQSSRMYGGQHTSNKTVERGEGADYECTFENLDANMQFYYRGYYSTSSGTTYTDVKTFKTSYNNKVKYVDLGLQAALWAEENMDGEYEWVSSSTLWRQIYYGLPILDNVYNIDHVLQRWGAPWRMPWKDEFDELIEKCTFEFTSVNGVKGWKVIGPNGNSVFFKAKQYKGDSSNYYGYYWSGNNVKSYYDYPYALYLDTKAVGPVVVNYYYGNECFIHPVMVRQNVP